MYVIGPKMFMPFLDIVAEVCILHLNVGVYIFFHRLYAMFPNNFLMYLQSLYNGEKNSRKELIFQQIIKVFVFNQIFLHRLENMNFWHQARIFVYFISLYLPVYAFFYGSIKKS